MLSFDFNTSHSFAPILPQEALLMQRQSMNRGGRKKRVTVIPSSPTFTWNCRMEKKQRTPASRKNAAHSRFSHPISSNPR